MIFFSADNMNVNQLCKEIIDECSKGHLHRGFVLKNEEYYTCGGDCEVCMVPQLAKLILAMTNAKADNVLTPEESLI